MVTLTFSCEQDSKTGCKLTKKVYDKSSRVKFGSRRKEQSPSKPIDGHDININDSINGHEAVVADKHSSVSWLYAKKKNQSTYRQDTKKIINEPSPAKGSIQRCQERTIK